MKVTVDVKPQDLKDVMRLSGEKSRAAALQKFLSNNLQLSRRCEVIEKFVSGEWGTEGVTGADKKLSWS